jgi:hypothetical protein
MYRELKYLIIGLIIVCAAGAILYFITHPLKETDDNNSFSKVPGRITELGPYAKNISLTENIGAYSMNISAEQVLVKKGKFLVFKTALQKKFVMNNLHISLYKNGVKMLELSKDKAVLDSFMRNIEIETPRILYPETMDQPVKIRLEKEKKLLTIHYRNKTDVWNLAN